MLGQSACIRISLLILPCSSMQKDTHLRQASGLKRGTGKGTILVTLVTRVHASKTSKADKRRTLDEGA